MNQPGDQPSSDTAGFTPGAVIAGKYVVERLLGKGGMGVVVAARHLQLREEVALKFLHVEMARKPALVIRFDREARAAARIKSEHVARVLDVGTMEDGVPFIVMEMLSGSDLHRLSAARGPLPWNEAALYVAQACDAVAEAHRYGIVHRDLKPANLFLTHRADGSPLVKVLDFGISKMAEEGAEELTATTDVLGSPLYMSPEQIESPKDVDARADVWALGAILYKLLSGRAAFAAATAGSSLAKIVKDAPPPLHPQRPDVPPELEALVMRCLEKDLNNRVQTVVELARALQPFSGLGPPEWTGAGSTYSHRVEAPARSRRPAAMLAVVVATMVVAGLSVLLVGSRAARPPPPLSASVTMGAPLGAAPIAAPKPPQLLPPTSASIAPSVLEAKPEASASAPAPSAAVPSASVGGSAVSKGVPARSGKPVVPSRGPSDAFSDRL